MSLRKGFLRVHWISCILLISSLLLRWLTGYGPTLLVESLLLLLLVTSGFIGFFTMLSPFRLISVYFSYYVLVPLILVLFMWQGGILLGLMASLSTTLAPKELVYANDEIGIQIRNTGFMAGCCQYHVYQPQNFLANLYVGEFKAERFPLNNTILSASVRNNTLTIEASDTTLVFHVEP